MESVEYPDDENIIRTIFQRPREVTDKICSTPSLNLEETNHDKISFHTYEILVERGCLCLHIKASSNFNYTKISVERKKCKKFHISVSNLTLADSANEHVKVQNYKFPSSNYL